jgi:hypothetical protein
MDTRHLGNWNINGATNVSNVVVNSHSLVTNGNLRVSGPLVSAAVATTMVTTNIPQSTDSFSNIAYNGVKYLALVKESNKFQLNDIYVVQDGTTATALTAHTIQTSGNLGVFSANIFNGVVYLNFSAVTGGATVKVYPNYLT